MGNIKNKDIGRILLLAAALFVFLAAAKGVKNKYSLDRNASIVEAVVDTFYNIGTSFYYKYELVVDGISYEGSSTCSSSPNINVNDTIIVVYDKTNPKNNTALIRYKQIFYKKRDHSYLTSITRINERNTHDNYNKPTPANPCPVFRQSGARGSVIEGAWRPMDVRQQLKSGYGAHRHS